MLIFFFVQLIGRHTESSSPLKLHGAVQLLQLKADGLRDRHNTRQVSSTSIAMLLLP